MKVFWFFFSKKNRLHSIKVRKRFFLKKEAKTFYPFTVSVKYDRPAPPALCCRNGKVAMLRTREG
jgi:hypothetical protein